METLKLEERLAKMQARHAEEETALRAEMEVMQNLPAGTPDALSLIYTHGLRKPLYGASLGLKFNVTGRTDAADIAALFPPTPLELVTWGSTSPKSAYRSFWSAHYNGDKESKTSGGILSREPLAVPVYYKCDSYGRANASHSVHWYWLHTLPTFGLRLFNIVCEVERDTGRFVRTPGGTESPWSPVKGGQGSGPKTAHPDPNSLPEGTFKGRYGQFVGDLAPYVETYWPENLYGEWARQFNGDIPALLRDILQNKEVD
jgi:hypothetical protein